jgi:D-alanyl-D-alanine carboxypeptidase/D-alanyl-D-alanine-endopeptidase (penicillin-binding protein 4)
MLRRRYRLICAALCVVLQLPLGAAPKKNLEKDIAAVLARPDLARGFWGLEFVSLTTGRTLYSLNAEKLFTPASNTKLFSTTTAMALLGTDYKFKTTVETDGVLNKRGRITGDLLLVGHGDPNLSGRELPYNGRTQRNDRPVQALEDLADALARLGVKSVDGDLVADDTYYAFERYGAGWSQDDLLTGDGAPASALTINDNVVFVEIQPGDRVGDRAFVSVTPFADYYRIDNRLKTIGAGGQEQVFFNRELGSTTVTIWGEVPIDHKSSGEALAIEDPAAYAASLFRAMLEKRGIAVYGRNLVLHTELASLPRAAETRSNPGTTSPDTASPGSASAPPNTVLASYESKPLYEDIRVINKVSQNLHAELLLRLLGKEKGTGGTIAGGLEVIDGFLKQAGVAPDEYLLHDGSGMSRENLVSPHALVTLLGYASRQPWAAQFRESLPVAGVDGSLAERFKDTPAAGKVAAKTGTLTGVKNLSGYLTTQAGETVAFSILTNNYAAPPKAITAAIDEIVEMVVEEAPRPKKK